MGTPRRKDRHKDKSTPSSIQWNYYGGYQVRWFEFLNFTNCHFSRILLEAESCQILTMTIASCAVSRDSRDIVKHLEVNMPKSRHLLSNLGISKRSNPYQILTITFQFICAKVDIFCPICAFTNGVNI